MLAVLMTLALSADAEAEVRVMSFNVRYGAARDGENAWPQRRALVAETVRAFGPDLLGTQETLGFQRAYLSGQLPGYAAFGVGRDDGADAGEQTAVFYRTDRFEKTGGGHFWLSETPDVPGSVSWDSSLTRMATWVVLEDRRTGAELLFANTHFDHRGRRAREESAKLLRSKLPELAAGRPLVLTGDFNAAEGSRPYEALFGGDSPLRDAFRAANPTRGEAEGTFNGFDAAYAGAGGRIDWIAVSDGWAVESASIDRRRFGGRTPSDHEPVTAVLRPRAAD